MDYAELHGLLLDVKNGKPYDEEKLREAIATAVVKDEVFFHFLTIWAGNFGLGYCNCNFDADAHHDQLGERQIVRIVQHGFTGPTAKRDAELIASSPEHLAYLRFLVQRHRGGVHLHRIFKKAAEGEQYPEL